MATYTLDNTQLLQVQVRNCPSEEAARAIADDLFNLLAEHMNDIANSTGHNFQLIQESGITVLQVMPDDED